MQFACEGDCAADVAAALIGAGLRLNRLQPVETSLESIYLELVGADAQQQPGMTGPPVAHNSGGVGSSACATSNRKE